jgi:hypothetical protein
MDGGIARGALVIGTAESLGLRTPSDPAVEETRRMQVSVDSTRLYRSFRPLLQE